MSDQPQKSESPSGFNRTSTLVVERFEVGNKVEYKAKSAGFGMNAYWLGEFTDSTLARALRGLQNHYQQWAGSYSGAAAALQKGRQKPNGGAACP